MSGMDLNTTWFIIIGVLITGYAILDGFDLGVGVLHLFTKNNKERRISMNAIGPVWDGNEVWLLTAGGAMFAAFPIVYATVFSGFYIAFMLLLFALIFRAVSLEFRGKVDSAWWQKTWDLAFGISSLVAAILFGAAIGNVLRGLPITADGSLNISFIEMLNPYSLLIGVLSLVMFVMHGASYMTLKTEGDMQQRMAGWMIKAWMAFIVLYLVASLATVLVSKFLFEGILGSIFFWILLPLLLAAAVYIPIAVQRKFYLRGFFSSCMVIACAIGLMGVGLFPRMAPSSINLDYSLTIHNASSSPRTLQIMLIIALIGMPLVIAYTAFIYTVFKGKVVVTKDSY
jgi:cytochrome bd ubiquinol oxidase subunit II